MIGLDSNVLVRYLAKDDLGQLRQAEHLIDGHLKRGEDLFVSIVTLVETLWTLRSRYHVPQDALCDIVDALAGTVGIRLADADCVTHAASLARTTGCDFPDALIAELGRRAGCSHTATFDSAAARKLDAMRSVIDSQ